MKSIILTVGILLCMATSAWADGSEFYCSDHYGRKAKWIESKSLGLMAQADYKVNGTPVIYTSSDAAAATGLSADSLQFLRYHECGRLVLGHEVRPGSSRDDRFEQVDHADCWAANRFYYAGEESKLAGIQEEINALDNAAWVHIGGPARKLDLESICRFKKPVWAH